MAPAGKRTVFVTVGTTQFDELVSEVTKLETLRSLNDQGYSKIVVQFGSGKIPKVKHPGFSSFDFKNSLQSDMQAADLIISHAGAGSILEAVRIRKSKVRKMISSNIGANNPERLMTS